MAHSNVSSCVMSIVASFSSGLDVFKKLRDTRKRRRRVKAGDKAGDKAEEENEIRLSKSLRRGPEDIGREYQRNLQNAGDEFAVGDGAAPRPPYPKCNKLMPSLAIAQTSLAEILLKLNTGTLEWEMGATFRPGACANLSPSMLQVWWGSSLLS